MLIKFLVIAFVSWFAFNATRINFKEGGTEKVAKFWLRLGLNLLFWITLFKIFQFSVLLGQQLVVILLVGGVIYWIIQVTRD